MRRLFTLLLSLSCFLLISCTSNNSAPSENQAIPTIVTSQNESLESKESSKTALWESKYKNDIDLNKDQKNESIDISTSGNDTSTFFVKVLIDGHEQTYGFDSQYNLLKFIHCDPIRIGNGAKALLIILASTNESHDAQENVSPPWWFDRNFIIVGYVDDKISTIIDGTKIEYNIPKNYRLKYLDDFTVEFRDVFTHLSTKIKLVSEDNESKNIEDEILFKFGSTNNEIDAGVGINYTNITITQSDENDLDAISCLKFIPGVIGREMLGTIEYSYKFSDYKSILDKATLKYKEEGVIDKVTEVSFD